MGKTLRELDLGEDVRLTLVRVPAGEFLMGDVDGRQDEYPQRVVRIEQPFWIGQCEVTNAQFRRFDPAHDSRYYVKRRDRADGKGLSMNEPNQPAVRVSWEQSLAFCRWLSQRIQLTTTAPRIGRRFAAARSLIARIAAAAVSVWPFRLGSASSTSASESSLSMRRHQNLLSEEGDRYAQAIDSPSGFERRRTRGTFRSAACDSSRGEAKPDLHTR